MKFLRNGSLAANASLLVLGAVLGSVGTWHVARQSLATPSSATEPAKKPDSSGIRVSTKLAANDNFPESRSEKFRNAGEKAAANPETGFAGASEIPSHQDQLDYLRGFYGAWSQEDAAAAAAHAKSHLPAGLALSEALSVTAHNWGKTDPTAAWKWVEESLSGPLKQETLTSLLQGWTSQNPNAASRWLLDSGLTSAPFFDAVASTRAATDPQGAVDFAKSIPDDQTRKTALVTAIGKIAEDNPATAAPIVEPIVTDPKNPDGIDIATALINLWGTTDPAASAKWIDSLPPGPARTEATNTLATVWAASDINAAVAWSQRVADPDMREQIIQHLGTTWGAIEPDKALTWLQTLPPNEAKNGIEGALNSWAATDPVGLRQWIDSTGSNSMTDTARLSLGDTLTDTNINDSLNLALGIADPTARDGALIRFLHQWRKTDPDSAQDWVNTQWSELSTTTQAKVNQEMLRQVQLR